MVYPISDFDDYIFWHNDLLKCNFMYEPEIFVDGKWVTIDFVGHKACWIRTGRLISH
jgi:hypothetical protein